MNTVSTRRAAAAVTASLAVAALALGSGALVSAAGAAGTTTRTSTTGTTGTRAAAPTAAVPEDCATPADIGALKVGDAVHGLTVGSGTTPDDFDGEVLGILDGGIAPGLDMVLVRLTSPEIDRVGGIWQGMSGSPVYTADGDLVGAVSYGLAWGSSPVAGITPFGDMDDYLGASTSTRPAGRPGARPRGTVRVGPALARRIAARTDVTAAQAARGMTQLPMPYAVSGVSARRLAQGSNRRWMPAQRYAAGSVTGAAAPAPETLEAGGNLAATLSYGDITSGGVGTVTSVCGGRVVGFGHPMLFAGETTMGLAPADAVVIQEDPLGVPFKVANIGDTAGTITDDHLTGITGTVGAMPAVSDVSSSVTFGARQRTGTSHVVTPDQMAGTAFYQVVSNHDRVFDAVGKGSETQAWTITGHDATGRAFTLRHGDRYASDYDITWDASFDLADLVYGLSSLPGVSVDSVRASSAMSRDSSSYRVVRAQQRVGHRWVTLGRKQPAVGQAGHKVRIRVLLQAADGRQRTTTTSFLVPRRAQGLRGNLSFAGGNETWSEAAYQRTFQGIVKALASDPRNDQVVSSLTVFGERLQVQRTRRSSPQDLVVNGGKRYRLKIS